MFDTSWIGPAVQSLDAARSNVWRVQEARHADRVTDRRLGTQYQTAMADMRAAGLNPMLAYDQGGAGAPPGVAANIQDSDIGGAISSALQTKRLGEEVQNMRMDRNEMQSRINKNIVDTSVSEEQRDLVNYQKQLLQTQIAGAKNVEAFERDIGKDTTYMRRILELIRLLRGSSR